MGVSSTSIKPDGLCWKQQSSGQWPSTRAATTPASPTLSASIYADGLDSWQPGWDRRGKSSRRPPLVARLGRFQAQSERCVPLRRCSQGAHGRVMTPKATSRQPFVTTGSDVRGGSPSASAYGVCPFAILPGDRHRWSVEWHHLPNRQWQSLSGCLNGWRQPLPQANLSSGSCWPTSWHPVRCGVVWSVTNPISRASC